MKDNPCCDRDVRYCDDRAQIGDYASFQDILAVLVVTWGRRQGLHVQRTKVKTLPVLLHMHWAGYLKSKLFANNACVVMHLSKLIRLPMISIDQLQDVQSIRSVSQ